MTIMNDKIIDQNNNKIRECCEEKWNENAITAYVYFACNGIMRMLNILLRVTVIR